MLRNNRDAREDDIDVGAAQRPRRTALEDAQRLGGLYAALNYLAPLVRLSAIGSAFFGHQVAYHRLIPPVMAVVANSIARVPLFRLSKRLALQIQGPRSKHQFKLHLNLSSFYIF
jgi:hypothetical protein